MQQIFWGGAYDFILRKAGTFDESDHPRHPKGSGENAGEFAPKAGGKAKMTPEQRAAARSAARQAKIEAAEVEYNKATAMFEKLERATKKPKTLARRFPYLFNYDKNDVKSMTEDPRAGFPKGHPLADPETRMGIIDEAGQALSYSNIVGLGGALRLAQYERDGGTINGNGKWLMDKMSERLPKGMTLNDINDAMYRETQARLRKAGIKEIVAYRGIPRRYTANGPYGDRTTGKYEMRGLVSWSADRWSAGGFGSEVIAAKIPAERIQALPYLFPTALYGNSALVAFGGSRDEGEIITRGDWSADVPIYSTK